MTLRFVDSFDHYTTAQITRKWNASNGTISAGTGRRSTAGYILGQNVQVTKNFATGHATWTVGFAFKLTAAPNTAAIQLLKIMEGTSEHMSLRIAVSATAIQVTRNGTLLATSPALSTGTFYYIEFKTTINDTTGAYELRFDGVAVVGPTTGVDTQNGGTSSADTIQFGPMGNNSTISTTVMDDLYVCDGAGAVNTGFLGDCRVDVAVPTGAGATTGLTPSAGSNFQNVDENPSTDDTDYNEHATDGTKDTYACTDLSHSPTSVYGVQINTTAKKDDAGNKGFAPVTRSGGSDNDGSTHALSTSYTITQDIRELDPNGSIAWTQTSFNAAEFGFKVKDI